MAVSMQISTPVFIKHLCAHLTDHELQSMQHRAQVLEAAGWKFLFNMFMVTLSRDGVMIQENFPNLIPKLISGKLKSHEVALCVPVFMNLLKAAEAKMDGIVTGYKPEADAPAVGGKGKNDAIKAIIENVAGHVTPGELKAAGKTATKVPTSAIPAKVSQAAGKPGASLGQLKYATSINEMIEGTSNPYRVVALGELNVAIRVAANGVSIRVERGSGDFTTLNVSRLTAIGFSKKPDYMSLHMTLNEGMPASRVVGAVLMSMEVPFKSMITNGKDLK